MIQEIISAIKNSLGNNELHNTYKEYVMYKSNLNGLHAHYENVIDTMENGDIKKSFEDAHFADLFELYKQNNDISHKLSSELLTHAEMLRKAETRFKYVDKLKKSLGKKRSEMPQVDSENITDFVLHFSNKVGVTKVKRKIGKLKPSQIDFDEDKVMHFIDELKNDTLDETKYIISSDNYILDGHHRWAADLEVRPDSDSVECYRINLPAEDLIKQANKLKITKNVDIDDETFMKAMVTIALAKAQGFLPDDLLELVKAQNNRLIPVNRIVMRGGKTFNQIFWVDPADAARKRGTIVVDSHHHANTELPTDQVRRAIIVEDNEKKDKVLFAKQKEDDSICNVGDIVDVKYVGRTSGKPFEFEGLKVVSVDSDTIKVQVKEHWNTGEKYHDGVPIVFMKNAILSIPKHNNQKWGLQNNYTLKIEESDRKERLHNLRFLDTIREYAVQGREKGFSVFEDAVTMSDEQVRDRYAPYFAKYGNTHNPIEMFDNCKKHIDGTFGEDCVKSFEWTLSGFKINVVKDGKNQLSTTRTFSNGDNQVPPDHNKGMYHAYFEIQNKKYWGTGLAKNLFCEYYTQYKKLGLEFLATGPALRSGPYVWPSYAFYFSKKQAEDTLAGFKEGATRDIKTFYVEQEPDVEKAYEENGKIYIKYSDADLPIDVTNEKDYAPEINKKREKILKELEEKEGLIKTGLYPTNEDQAVLSGLHADVTSLNNQLENLPKVKKYRRESEGIIDITKCKTHTISKLEEDEAKRVHSEWLLHYPNAKLFKTTLWTKNPILRDACKVAMLNVGNKKYGNYVVDLKNEAHRKDFEKSIGYEKYLKLQADGK